MKRYILVIMLFILGMYLVQNRQKNAEVVRTSPEPTNSIMAKTNIEEGIEIGVEPMESSDKKTWNFKITITTHEGSLDQDLTNGSILKNEKDDMLSPLGWEGSPPGGHHREGILSFPAFMEEPKTVTLKLSGFGKRERVFTWDLNNL